MAALAVSSDGVGFKGPFSSSPLRACPRPGNKAPQSIIHASIHLRQAISEALKGFFGSSQWRTGKWNGR